MKGRTGKIVFGLGRSAAACQVMSVTIHHSKFICDRRHWVFEKGSVGREGWVLLIAFSSLRPQASKKYLVVEERAKGFKITTGRTSFCRSGP